MGFPGIRRILFHIRNPEYVFNRAIRLKNTAVMLIKSLNETGAWLK